MMFNFTSYKKAGSIQEALDLLKANPEAKLLAGGTDLLVKNHKGDNRFKHLIDIHDVAELNFITMTDDGDLVIGPGTCFREVCESPLVLRNIPVLAEAVRTIGGPQIRNMATIGGNICNGNPCADSVPPLMALNAVLTLDGADGPRQVPLGDFFLGPGLVALEKQEILTAITITLLNYEGCQGHYYKYSVREAMDIAIIGCAAVCRVEEGILRDLRLAYSTAAPVPIRCASTEKKAAGRQISNQLLDETAAAVKNDVDPRTSWRATKDFRRHIIETLARRVVKQAVLNAGGGFNDSDD